MILFGEDSSIVCQCNGNGCGESLTLTGKINWKFGQDINDRDIDVLKHVVNEHDWQEKVINKIKYHLCYDCSTYNRSVMRIF